MMKDDTPYLGLFFLGVIVGGIASAFIFDFSKVRKDSGYRDVKVDICRYFELPPASVSKLEDLGYKLPDGQSDADMVAFRVCVFNEDDK